MEDDPYYADIDFDEYSQSDFTEEAADFWDSLDDTYKLEFLTDSVSHLTNFSLEVNQPWLAEFLPDAITFYELYGTWETYICPDPDCLRLFRNDESLIIHLKCEHFPEIHPVGWPTQRHSLAEQRQCADALLKMVWKPIVVEAALDMLSSKCLEYEHVTVVDVCSGFDRLNSLNWLYSDNPKRKSLLLVLAEKFHILLAEHDEASFSLLSEGYLTTMFGLASKHIFADRPHRHNKMYLQRLLACTPISFCLLEAADLDRFVELVDPMCRFVQQSMNRESGSVGGDVKWESENQDTHFFSQNESLFYCSEEETLRYGDKEFTKESILSLCHGPCIPTVPRVSPKANEIFSSLKNVVNEHRVPVSTGAEQKHLQLLHRMQCLESQLRLVCTLDCRVYIVPLMRSFLRMKLYFCLRCRRLNAEKDPAALCPTPSYQEDSESEYDSDYEESEVKIFDYDLNLHYKPWRDNPTLYNLDSTLSESATGETEGSGPFFWLAISDVLRHCEKNPCGAGYESVRGGIQQFRLYKTWKYWLCYDCDSTFIDRESHMVHLENEHQLSICNNEYWLIPQQHSGDEGRIFRQDVRESGLDNSITLDCTYDYFLVDSTKFYEIPSASEEEEPGQEKHKKYLTILHGFEVQLRILNSLFEMKRNILKELEVVNAFGLMLINGGQPLSLLVSRLRELSIVDWRIGTTHQLQFRFLSQLLDRAHASCYGPLNNNSVLKAFKDSESMLTCQLTRIDQKILRIVYEIDDMKCYLSNLCECDHRTKIVPSVRSLLHAKFKFDSSLRSLEFSNMKDFLLTLNQWLNQGKAYSFKVQVASPGKVVINTMEKSSWALAFIGIQLRFSGKWCVTKETELTGVFKFGGWSNWGASSWGRSGSLTLDDRALMEAISCWHFLEDIICTAISDMLLSFTYKCGAKIRCHGV